MFGEVAPVVAVLYNPDITETGTFLILALRFIVMLGGALFAAVFHSASPSWGLRIGAFFNLVIWCICTGFHKSTDWTISLAMEGLRGFCMGYLLTVIIPFAFNYFTPRRLAGFVGYCCAGIVLGIFTCAIFVDAVIQGLNPDPEPEDSVRNTLEDAKDILMLSQTIPLCLAGLIMIYIFCIPPMEFTEDSSRSFTLKNAVFTFTLFAVEGFSGTFTMHQMAPLLFDSFNDHFLTTGLLAAMVVGILAGIRAVVAYGSTPQNGRNIWMVVMMIRETALVFATLAIGLQPRRGFVILILALLYTTYGITLGLPWAAALRTIPPNYYVAAVVVGITGLASGTCCVHSIQVFHPLSLKEDQTSAVMFAFGMQIALTILFSTFAALLWDTSEPSEEEALSTAALQATDVLNQPLVQPET